MGGRTAHAFKNSYAFLLFHRICLIFPFALRIHYLTAGEKVLKKIPHAFTGYKISDGVRGKGDFGFPLQ